MAMRPVFLPKRSRTHFVLEAPVEFQWSAGLSTSQKQKSIASLHQAARQHFGVRSPLEVSSKSASPLGVALSAFNLRLQLEGGEHATVESAFQASKKFAQAGPFPELLEASSRDAKRDRRLRDSGPLVAFELLGIADGSAASVTAAWRIVSQSEWLPMMIAPGALPMRE